MFPLLFAAALITHLGPMGPETPAREPQMVSMSNGSAIAAWEADGRIEIHSLR
jgi:hypothetical protein